MRKVMTANFKFAVQLLSWWWWWWWWGPCHLHRVKSYTDISMHEKAQGQIPSHAQNCVFRRTIRVFSYFSFRMTKVRKWVSG